MKMQTIDLTSGSYTDWIRSVFNNPVTSPIWYFNPEVIYKSDATKTLLYLKELFLQPESLLDDFNVEQIEQGLWVICCSGGLLEESIGSKEASADLKKSVIKSTFKLFEKLLKIQPLRSISDMWWDALTQALSCEDDVGAQQFIGKSYKEIQKSIYEVLCKILSLSSVSCVLSALHGLGHLQYPGTSATIGMFIKENPSLDREVLDYARACVLGDIL